MRLIDADVLIELISREQKNYPITDRREIAKAMRIVLFEMGELIKEQPTIKTCSASSSCSMYMEDNECD